MFSLKHKKKKPCDDKQIFELQRLQHILNSDIERSELFLLFKNKFSILLFETHLHKLNDHVHWPNFKEEKRGWKKRKRPGHPKSRVSQKTSTDG